MKPESEPSSRTQKPLWPLALLGILVTSSVALLGKSKSKSNQTRGIYARTRQDKTIEESDDAPKEEAIITDVVPTPPPKYKTTECRPDQTPWWKALGEFIAFSTGLFLLWINITQMKSTQKAAEAAENAATTAKKQLEISQRPWVGLGSPIVPQQFQLTPQVSVQVVIPLKNFGGSPALKVMADMEPASAKELHQRAPHVCDLILRFVNGTIPENQLQGPQIKRGFTLFPGEPFAEPMATGDSTLKPESIDTLYFIGCIAYRDQFEKTHTTRFCVETPRLAKNYKLGQPFISCSVYNESD